MCEPFTNKEILEALLQIGSLKIPGPDGFPTRFFRRNWSTLRDSVMAVVKDSFRTSIMPEGVNSNSIVLFFNF